MHYNPARIRNFAIIAHIDHGKSTLADRLIQQCGGLTAREMTAQVLDSMDIEKERGITIKAQTVRLAYKAKDGHTYQLNLMDTPGHVDFGYEVSRSLASCEGSILVVDASQGVEAQTLTNVYQAIDNNHEIVVVLNKIDLPAAEPERVREQIEQVIGIDASDAILASAKTGQGIEDILEAIVTKLPAPSMSSPESRSDSRAIHSETGTGGKMDAPRIASGNSGHDGSRALLVDSWYDPYLGVVILIRVKEGRIRKGQKIRMLATGGSYTIDYVGIFTPKKVMLEELNAGEIGFITASIKQVADCKVGDTIADAANETALPLPGFKPHLPVVFCGLFPVDADDFDALREAIAKLHLNDASFEYEQETSTALGLGFRCGFLGLLHLEIIQERLSREFDLDLITTAPSVVYRLHMKNTRTEPAKLIELHNPADMPDPVHIEKMEEPWIRATIMVPEPYLGNILELCTKKRGIQQELNFSGSRAIVVYRLPLNEVVYDFYDRLKSVTSGYASFDWELADYQESDLVKVSILVNEEPVDALAMILHRSQAEARGRQLCSRLKDLIPRQMFKIALQAAISGKIVARETISAFRKDVTAKCYGGDISRKKKLLEKQKKGKKKMRSFGNVEIPQTAFIAALKMDE